MKLAIITPYWKTQRGGGINTYTVGLIDILKKITDIDIRVGFILGNGNEDYKIPDKDFSSILGTVNVLNKIKPNIIQVHEDWPLLLGSALYKLFNYKVKLIYVPLTEPNEPTIFLQRFKYAMKKLVLKWTFRQCNSIIISDKMFLKMFNRIHKISIGEKTIFIAPGTEQKKVSNEEINEFCLKFNIKDNSTILLIQAFTANELKSEGIILSVKVLKNLKKKYPNIILILTREGRFSSKLKKIVENENIKSNVIFTGDVSNPFVPLQICDIFLWPWLGETGFGLALLEAMLVGKPIIATSKSGSLVPLENNENCLMVKPTEDEIFNAVIELINNRKLVQKISENAKKTVFDNYTWEIIGKKFMKLYDSINKRF